MLFETKNLEFKSFLNYNNLNIKSNETTFITGKSGSGKSTLFKLFNKTYSPSNGEIFYKGENIKSIDPQTLRKKVLLASQDVFLFSGSIKDNFYKFSNYNNIENLNDDLIRYTLNLTTLDFDIDKDISGFSGGERQRLFLAIMVSMPFETLLLDEPTAALDSLTSTQFIENIINFCKNNNKEIMIISHSNEIKEKYSTQTIEINNI